MKHLLGGGYEISHELLAQFVVLVQQNFTSKICCFYDLENNQGYKPFRAGGENLENIKTETISEGVRMVQLRVERQFDRQFWCDKRQTG